MNNLPNTERKCRNVDSFLAFLLFVCLLFTAPYVRAQETLSLIHISEPTRHDWI